MSKTLTRDEIYKIIADGKNHTLQDTVKEDCKLDGKKIEISDFENRINPDQSRRSRGVKENSWNPPTTTTATESITITDTPKKSKKKFPRF